MGNGRERVGGGGMAGRERIGKGHGRQGEGGGNGRQGEGREGKWQTGRG